MTKIKKKKEINKINFYLIIFILIFSLMAGYFYWQNKSLKPSGSSPQPVDIFTQESEAEILKIVKPMAENFVQSFAVGDFVKASQDFDNEMKININTQVLETVQGQTLAKIGNLLSLGQPKIAKKETDFLILEYPEAKFAKEEKVLIRIVFKNDSGGNSKISGFWFDSPKLNSN